ncbi:hypothetical protein ACH4JS_30880 [Streptomyces sp. NPDC017638]|uniref:hypothetical protein n=1 Tax=Streptomyces sp. NPDC017638 TaxID=3365004 RepID=UPI0037BAE324
MAGQSRAAWTISGRSSLAAERVVPARHGELVRLGKALSWYDGTPLAGQDRLLTHRPRPPPPDRPPVIPALAWT